MTGGPRTIVGLGAGGHAIVMIDLCRQMPGIRIVGLLDREQARHGGDCAGIAILGGDERIPELMGQGVDGFFVGVGSVRSADGRRRLYELAVGHGLEPLQAIHPSAIVSPTASVGAGAALLAGVVINAGAQLGVNVLINTAAIVEHGCVVGDHVHVASGARVLGDVQIGEGAHIGAGATILQGVRIGRGATVGAGAVVLHDVADGETVVGVPARDVRKAAGVR